MSFFFYDIYLSFFSHYFFLTKKYLFALSLKEITELSQENGALDLMFNIYHATNYHRYMDIKDTISYTI